VSQDTGERRLAAILSADVAGYSRLMGDDEAATVDTLTRYRAVFRDAIARHHGRVVDAPGDNLLAEFASPVEAVACAGAVQRELGRRNRQLAEHRRMDFRIGINLGDIIARDGALYGDGVNIAARLEGLAEPGGICVSGTVFDQADGKVEAGFAYLGEQAVKNIARPVRAYNVVSEADVAPEDSEPPLALPDKPSIAVLSFDNLSGDPEQEYFADGIAEDLITALSRLRWLFVTARNSTFAYKGRSPDIRQVGRELGVRYVLEGSVRKGGARVRVSAQLIDATTGNHVWAERYDRELTDLFDLQDEITETIAAAIEPELGMAERERARRKPPDNLDAWETYQRGLWHFYQFSGDENGRARELFARALEFDPGFAPVHASLAYSHLLDVSLGWGQDRGESLDLAGDAAQRAVALDDKDGFAHTMLGRFYVVVGELDAAMDELGIAIRLNPSFPLAHYGLGQAMMGLGRPDEGIAEIDTAERLSPHDPYVWLFDVSRSVACFSKPDYEAALRHAEKARRRGAQSGFWPDTEAAAALAQLGRHDEAARALASARARQPRLSMAFVRRALPFTRQEPFENFFDGLRKAGLGDEEAPAGN
jgi:TolB-like protein/Flp pilus assembly protein TadD